MSAFAASVAPARIVLLGTGTVGSEVLARLAHRDPSGVADRLQLVAVANTRVLRLQEGACPSAADAVGDHAGVTVRALGTEGTRIVVDATASDAIAARHADWLAAGIHVATACKLGQGATLARWRAIRDACGDSGCHYGDSATVGAGLPVLRTIRALRAGGDRIRGIAGVLSGSLAWMLSRYDGSEPFAALVEEARLLGYTEPDPALDLGGEDVRRKLLILARAAGIALDTFDVRVEPLQPGALPARHAQALRDGRVLRHVARLDCGAGGAVAKVGLEALVATDPLAGGGSDNRVAIWSDRYPAQPLSIQGPGAGAAVTAAALLDDALRIARKAQAYSGATDSSGPGAGDGDAADRPRAARYASSGLGWSIA